MKLPSEHRSTIELVGNHYNGKGLYWYMLLLFFSGFDDEDMMKPHFNEPASQPFVPYVLSDPETQPPVQVSVDNHLIVNMIISCTLLSEDSNN